MNSVSSSLPAWPTVVRKLTMLPSLCTSSAPADCSQDLTLSSKSLEGANVDCSSSMSRYCPYLALVGSDTSASLLSNESMFEYWLPYKLVARIRVACSRRTHSATWRCMRCSFETVAGDSLHPTGRPSRDSCKAAYTGRASDKSAPL